jgi:hypothetical protein
VKLEVNREELEKKLTNITSALLREKGYISLVDVFIGLGYLSEKDVEEWRMKRIPYLEKCIGVNLSKASYIVKTVRSNCIKGKLRESYTSYKSWGKGKKSALRFSKSGQSNIEVAYATHFTKPKRLA